MERLPCTHKGTYADDCLCERVKQVGGTRWLAGRAEQQGAAGPAAAAPLVNLPLPSPLLRSRAFSAAGHNPLPRTNHRPQHRCYIVATCDRDLRRRIRKIPGVPIMYIQSHKYSIERLPEATMGGAPRA